MKQVKPPLFCPPRISPHCTSTTVNSCSYVSKSCNSGVAWTVNCLWRRLCIIKSGNKKPQHWKVAAKHLVKEKVHSQLRCVICPPFCLFTCFATMQQPLVTSPRGPVVLRLHVNASYFSTTVRRVTPPTWGPPLPCKQALIFFRDCQSSGIIIF